MKLPPDFRKRVLAREWLCGTFLNLGSPITVEIAGLAGFDWILIDHEHGPGGQDTLLHQLHAASATPAVPIVRIAANETPRFKRVLDMGALGVILAAILLTLLPELLRPIAEYRMIIYSLMLIVLMLARPQGLFNFKFGKAKL